LLSRSPAGLCALISHLLPLGFVVGSANNLIEAMFFGVLRPREVAAAAVPAAIIFVILAPVAGLFAGRWKSAGVAVLEAGGFTPLTLLAVVIASELLYWTSGILVYTYIADFYATRTIPPAYLVAAVQIPRSLIFIGAVYPLLKSGLRGGPLVLALVYGVIGGVAPLLPDNPYMPPDIRFYHAIETSLSNFIFGLTVDIYSRAAGLRFRFRRKLSSRSRPSHCRRCCGRCRNCTGQRRRSSASSHCAARFSDRRSRAAFVPS
jgi:hypothetical protein